MKNASISALIMSVLLTIFCTSQGALARGHSGHHAQAGYHSHHSYYHGPVHIRSYTRKSGKHVHSYSRRYPRG